jgi:hypothetical protein
VKMSNEVTRLNNKGDRLIRDTILRCIDGRWPTKDGEVLPLGTRLYVVGTVRALQCWINKELMGTEIETPDEPLRDPALLNEQIPRDKWGLDLNGAPKPPWVITYVVYLVDPATASGYTYLNSTTGARIAFERLQSRIDNMRIMRGGNPVPLIELDTRPMKTPFGQKMRPEFTIVKDEWREFGGGGEQPALLPPPDKGGPDGAAAKPEKKSAANKPGKPVKEPSAGEEMKDSLPNFA